MAPPTANPRAPINNFASLLLSKGCDTEEHGTPRVVEPRAVAKQLSKTGAEVIKIGSAEHLNEVFTNQGYVGEEADRAPPVASDILISFVPLNSYRLPPFFMNSAPQNEYAIPADAEVVFVQDFFTEDLLGGAELTSDAFIHYSPYRVHKLHGASLTAQLLQQHRDKIWLFGNFQSVNLSLLGLALNLKVTLYIIEYDFKFCDFRLPQLHESQMRSPCDCHLRDRGKFIARLYNEATKSFFMSEKQMRVYEDLFPTVKPNGVALSSAWLDEDLQYLRSLRASRTPNGRWAILKRDSFLKNQGGTESYARAHRVAYDLLGEMPYREFLRALSNYDGLIFHPAGYDTCPRLTIEAKLLGLQVLMNEHVQHRDEPWFNQSPALMEEYLRDIPHRLWRIVEATR